MFISTGNCSDLHRYRFFFFSVLQKCYLEARISNEPGLTKKRSSVVVCLPLGHGQCWASYSNNVIYYSLLVTPFKSIVLLYLLLSGNSN